jgi:hypothetical protein
MAETSIGVRWSRRGAAYVGGERLIPAKFMRKASIMQQSCYKHHQALNHYDMVRSSSRDRHSALRWS